MYRIDTRSPNVISLTGRNCARFEQEKTERTELAVPRMDDAVEVFCRRLLRSAFVFVLISKPRTALFPLLPSVQKLRSFEQEKTEGTELGVPWMDDTVEVFGRRLQDRHFYLSQFPNRERLCFLCYLLFKNCAHLNRRKRRERSWVCLGWMTRLKCFVVGCKIDIRICLNFQATYGSVSFVNSCSKILLFKKCATKNGDAENNVAI